MTSDAHILVVDDEADVRDLLQEHLIKQGFAVSTATGVAAAREVLGARAVDLVILDLRMPGEDGLSFARELRDRGGVAIVMLTASGEIVDRVVGLELGADDYVARPFDPRELLARIRSVLRRVQHARIDQSGGDRREVRFGHHVLDLDARRLFALDGSEVPITAMEFDLLEAFTSDPNRVLSRDRPPALDVRVLRRAAGFEPDGSDRAPQAQGLRRARRARRACATSAAKPPARERAVGALASGFATAEPHHRKGHDL